MEFKEGEGDDGKRQQAMAMAMAMSIRFDMNLILQRGSFIAGNLFSALSKGAELHTFMSGCD